MFSTLILGLACSPETRSSIENDLNKSMESVKEVTLETLLIGEWANISECNKERVVYTATGDYFYMIKKGGEWDVQEKGLWSVEKDVLKFGVKDSDNISILRVSSYTPNSVSFCGFDSEMKEDCSSVLYSERCASR